MQKTAHPIDPAEIMAYLDGELPVDRAAAAAAHLERCAECQLLAADLRAVSQGLTEWQVEACEAEAPRAVVETADRRTTRIPRWVWGLAGVAVLALLVVVPNWRRTKVVSQASLAKIVDGMVAEDQALAPLPASPQVSVDMVKTAKPAAMVARTAALNLSTTDFDRVRPAIDAIVQRHNGYLAGLNINAPSDSSRTLIATLRVPASGLQAALDELKQLGRLQSENQSGEEVGEQYRDLEARLANDRAAEQRLAEILRDRTGKLSDVLDVEREITRVRGEIEQMDSERKGLAGRVDYATVNLTVGEFLHGSLSGAAVEGYQRMAGGLVAVALFLTGIAPTVLVWTALLFFPARYAWRRWGRG